MTPLLRRWLPFAALGLALMTAYTFWPASAASDGGGSWFASASQEDVEAAKLRLDRLRTIAATVPAKEEVLKKVAGELAEREKGLLRTDTAAQAQAQLFSILRRVGQDDGIEVRQTQLGGVSEVAGGEYGLAQVNVQFECKIEQLVNFLAALSAQPELISTQRVDIETGDAKSKTVRVRLNASAVVPKELLPKKGERK